MAKVSKKNRKLIEEWGGEVMPFRDLPRPAQYAMAWYMAIDGEAWEMPPEFPPYEVTFQKIKRDFSKTLPFFIEKYGDKKFGYVEIPTPVMTKAIMEGEEIRDQFKEFSDYHRWYLKHGPMPRHERRNRWPVILSSFEDETLQDGWHRFHDYVRQGAEVIPALYYV